MTAKFDAFKSELLKLCQRHGVKLVAYGYDGADMYVEDLDDDALSIDISDSTRGTNEERAAAEAESQKHRLEWIRREQEARAAYLKMHEEELKKLMRDPAYRDLAAVVEAHAIIERRKYMRVSTDPNDPAYIDDRPRRAWVNDREIENWIVADEFRRVIITADSVHNGAVRIERLPEPGEPVTEPAPVAGTDLTGMFVSVPDAKPEPEVVKAEAPAPQPNPVPKFVPKQGKKHK